VQQYAREIKKEVRGFDAEARALLAKHAWPGNVRELRNCVERAVLLATGATLTVADLPPDVRRVATLVPASDGAAGGIALPARSVVLDDLLKSLLDQALLRCGGNKSRAAELLGIHCD